MSGTVCSTLLYYACPGPYEVVHIHTRSLMSWSVAALPSQPWVLQHPRVSPSSFSSSSFSEPSPAVPCQCPHLAAASTTAPAPRTPCWPTLPACPTSLRAEPDVSRTTAVSTSRSTTSPLRSRSTREPASSSPPALQSCQVRASGFPGREIASCSQPLPPCLGTSGTSWCWCAPSEAWGAWCSIQESHRSPKWVERLKLETSHWEPLDNTLRQ